jgi:hypothetical protein
MIVCLAAENVPPIDMNGRMERSSVTKDHQRRQNSRLLFVSKVILTLSGTLKSWRVQKSCLLAQTLTQSDIVKCCESRKRDSEEFVLTWSSLSSKLTMLDST